MLQARLRRGGNRVPPAGFLLGLVHFRHPPGLELAPKRRAFLKAKAVTAQVLGA